MSARANSLKPDDLSGATIEMIREMVKRAGAKLSSLQAHRTQIRRRIQALHHLSRTVAAEIAVLPLEDCAFAAGHSVKEQVLTGFGKRIERSERALQKSEPSAMRRACRIALMETDGAEGCTQILQRITRRQSVSFKNQRDSLQEITAELNRMVVDGEAITFGAGDAQQWQLNRAKNGTEPHSTPAGQANAYSALRFSTTPSMQSRHP
jgi:hypothetical protein